MELSRYVDKQTVATLQRLLPNAALEPIITPLSRSIELTRSTEHSVSIELPLPRGAEYRFMLFFTPEKQIHARVPNLSAKHYFWYMPFEDAAFGNSIEKLDRAFIQTVEKLISHDTRIIQRRGWLNHSFKCEFKSLEGWRRVYGMSALRLGGFNAPSIKGKQRIYSSPAISPLRMLRDELGLSER